MFKKIPALMLLCAIPWIIGMYNHPFKNILNEINLSVNRSP